MDRQQRSCCHQLAVLPKVFLWLVEHLWVRPGTKGTVQTQINKMMLQSCQQLYGKDILVCRTVTSSPSVKYSYASFLILNKLFCLCYQPADHDPQGGQHHVCTAARRISGKLLQDGNEEDLSHYNFWHHEQQQHEN